LALIRFFFGENPRKMNVDEFIEAREQLYYALKKTGQMKDKDE